MDVGDLKSANPPCSGKTEQFFIVTNVEFSGKNVGPKKLDAIEKIKQVKSICSGCSVKMECLSLAVERNEQVGIWGGFNFFSSKERKEAKNEIDRRASVH